MFISTCKCFGLKTFRKYIKKLAPWRWQLQVQCGYRCLILMTPVVLSGMALCGMIFQNGEQDLVNLPPKYKLFSNPMETIYKLLCVELFLGYKLKKR